MRSTVYKLLMKKIWVGFTLNEWAIPIAVKRQKYSTFIKGSTDITIKVLCFFIQFETKVHYNKDCEVIE